MKITRDDLDRIAKLAALEIPADEREQVCEDLNRILAYVRKLSQLKTDGIPPFTPGPEHTPLRPDEQRSAELDPSAFAPEFDGAFFLVPRLGRLSREEHE